MQLSTKARKALAVGVAASTVLVTGAMGIVPAAFAASHNDGCLVLASGTVWLITNGQRRGFTSAEVFASHGYNFGQVVAANTDDTALPVGAIEIYADGTLVKGPSDPLVYLVVNGQKRGFTSGSVFTGLGYSFANIQWAPVNTFSDIPTGANINSTSITGLPMSGPGPQSVTCSETGSGSGNLTGGAGSITLSANSAYGGETVGEGDSNHKVLAFDVEADDNSDVQITSVKVQLDQTSTADSRHIADYIDSVSVYEGSSKVGSADASSFSEDSHVYSKSISLSNAIVRAGDTETFSIAITALDNLDSGDIDSDAWDIGVANVRFKDAEGVVSTESETLDVTDNTADDTLEALFDFDTFATANSVDLKAALVSSDDSINKGHVINVDDTNKTTDEPILSFSLKADGDSDINVTEIPVLVTVTGASNVDDDITSITLWHDGSKIDTESVGSAVGTTEVYTFDNLNVDVNSGDTEKFMVKVDFKPTSGTLDDGDTIKAELDSTRVDLISATDQTGEDLTSSNLTGTALGEASEVRDAGIMVSLVGTPTAVVTAGDASASVSDSGTFKITFDVTAFDGDFWIDKTAPDTSGGATESDLDVTGTGTVTATITSDSGATEGTNAFEVLEGTTERFTITTNIVATTSGFFDVALTDLLYASTDVDGDTQYTFNLDDFKTPQVFLNDY